MRLFAAEVMPALQALGPPPAPAAVVVGEKPGGVSAGMLGS